MLDRIVELQIVKAGMMRIRAVGKEGVPPALSADATFPMFILRRAMESGVSFGDLSDAEGVVEPWDEIRYSSMWAINKMLARALNAMTFDPKAVAQ